MDEAFEVVDGWLSQPAATVVQDLAAPAIEHGAELSSCDAGPSRFPGPRWTDPLRR